MNLASLTIHELRELIDKKEISVEELTNSTLNRIDVIEEKVNAYVTITKEKALEQAKAIDEKLARGESLGSLAGIPMGLEDNICTEGIKTTCSSKMLNNFIPPYNATVVEKLGDANSILLGKLNMDEFGMGSSTENSAFFPTKNPWNFSNVPGSSAGGASVSADELIFALGCDTGGSLRQGAAFCGVVGLKPTYGTVSRYGLIANASSLEQIGPITKDVTDCALVMNTIKGHDAFDPTLVVRDYPDYTSFLKSDIKGMRIGIPKEYIEDGIDTEVQAKLKEAIKRMDELGAIVEECSLPHTKYALASYYILAAAESSSNLARYDGVRYGLRAEDSLDVVDMFCKTRAQGFGEEVKRRILLGTFALSSEHNEAYYVKALKVRNLIKQDFDACFKKYDCLLTPTIASVAFEFGSKKDALSMYQQDICTIAANLAGIPALSLPFGLVRNLPVGLQFMGQAFDEGKILQLAYTLEQNSQETRLKPNLEEVRG